MDTIAPLPLVNLVLLAALCLYVSFKANRAKSAAFFVLSLLSLILFELSSLFFVFDSSASRRGAAMTLLGLAFVPVTLIPLGQILARDTEARIGRAWLICHAFQVFLLVVVAAEIFTGRMIDWAAGILEQPIFLIEKQRRFLFLNTAVACGIVLFCFENTLRSATKPQQERLRYIFIGCLGIAFYLFYLSGQIVISSYISKPLLLSGSVLIFAASLLMLYSLIKYPFWEIRVFVSRRLVFGCLSLSALLLYLFVSGWAMGLLNAIQSPETEIIVPAALFGAVGLLLYLYLSHTSRKRIEAFIARNFFHSKHDYRYLWTQFSERILGSINLADILPKLTEFIADCLCVRHVIVWLAAPGSSYFAVAYSLDGANHPGHTQLAFRLHPDYSRNNLPDILTVATAENSSAAIGPLPIREFKEFRLTHLLPVKKNGEILGWVGIGGRVGDKSLVVEDEQLLISIVSQFANLIVTARLSSELLEAREWASFNRLSSFVIHDLKNLATQQSMVLGNANRLQNNPEFLRDAFKTFAETTDKMISLIADLSVQKGDLLVNHQPIDVLDLLKETCADLKIGERKNVRLIADFPNEKSPLLVSGDPNLLEKAFTNVLLNALQSLPNGEGTVEVKVSNPNGKILTSVTDTGCGMTPEHLRKLFRPFQTTKKGGTGIGLCHTRTIVESHRGHIRIESQVERGTRVEIELPIHATLA